MASDWWKNAIVYQIYVPSFCDSNGDGIGDINGVYSKLNYIKELGANVIWLSPINKSPMKDNGYDVSNYRSINPTFGTLPEFDRMVKKAHSLGIKVVMDFVANHTSIEHPWFKESRTSIDSQLRDFYIWRKPKKVGKNLEPPNDWIAWFGGPAWTYDEKTGEYFLHLFSPHQPDLNWENPVMREEIYCIMRFWLGRGIDGFRLDVIGHISKPLNSKGELIFPDGNEKLLVPNGPRVHEYLQEMNNNVFSKYNLITIGETVGANVDDAVRYANSDGTELSMIIGFEHLDLEGDFKWTDNKINLVDLKYVFEKWQTGLHGRAWNALYWCNHDQPRIVSRLGDNDEHREKSATMLATCLHFMQGTPFIYQGEELGMTNAPFADISEFRDIESINAYKIFAEESNYFTKEDMLRYLRLKSRDNSRTPMQWNDGPFAGFSKNEPWIMVNPNYTEINAEEQRHRTGSIFNYYQKLIKLRKEMDIITYGDFELLLPEHSDLFVYTRGYQTKKLLVVCNFSNEERTFILPAGFTGKNLLIANDETHRTYTTELSSQGYRPKPCVNLSPYGAAVYRRC